MITLISTKKLKQLEQHSKKLEQDLIYSRRERDAEYASRQSTTAALETELKQEKLLRARIEELEKQVNDGLQKIYDLEHPTITDENFVKLVFDNELNVAKPIVGFTDVTKEMLIEHSRVVPDGNEMWSTQLIIMSTAHEALTQILEPFTHMTE